LTEIKLLEVGLKHIQKPKSSKKLAQDSIRYL